MILKKLTTDHYVVVTDEPIEEGDSILMNGCIIRQCDYVDGYMIIDTTQGKHHASVCKKITHSTQPLELLSENGLSGMGFSKVRPLNVFEVKELIGEVDVEKKANDCIAKVKHNGSFIRGYNQALEDKKDKKYTEEDMRNAILIGMKTGFHPEYHIESANRIIQSIQSKTEWEVEFDENGKLKKS